MKRLGKKKEEGRGRGSMKESRKEKEGNKERIQKCGKGILHVLYSVHGRKLWKGKEN